MNWNSRGTHTSGTHQDEGSPVNSNTHGSLRDQGGGRTRKKVIALSRYLGTIIVAFSGYHYRGTPMFLSAQHPENHVSARTHEKSPARLMGKRATVTGGGFLQPSIYGSFFSFSSLLLCAGNYFFSSIVDVGSGAWVRQWGSPLFPFTVGHWELSFHHSRPLRWSLATTRLFAHLFPAPPGMSGNLAVSLFLKLIGCHSGPPSANQPAKQNITSRESGGKMGPLGPSGHSIQLRE